MVTGYFQSTDHGAFISPDLFTAYAGRFAEGKMASGRVVNVTGRVSKEVGLHEWHIPFLLFHNLVCVYYG